MDLPKWFFIEEPFFQSPSRMNNEHYAWFSWKQYRKVSNEKVCDENFFDRGTNKIACYLQLRVSGMLFFFFLFMCLFSKRKDEKISLH